jgi:4-hydroxyphenylpyruvate dioxygenase
VAFQVAHWSAFNEKLAVLGIATTPIVHPLTEAMGLTFTAWGNVRHSLFPRRQPLDNKAGLGLMAIDHVVLNVPKADFQAASSWYQTLFKWRVQQRFTITTPYSGLYSEALIDPGEQIQFNLNCPSNQHSQIQTFLNHNHGAGIQHVAFRSHSILETIKRLRQNSVAFLSVPEHYYVRKQQQFTATPRPDHSPHIDWQTLQDLGILVDGEKTHQSSLLLQIFTQPLFGQSSFFWEIIERCQRATGFGEGNFQALYEAVEAGENSH